MNVHIGKIVYNAVKSNKYSIGYISSKLDITRNTFYNKLKKPDLSLDFVIKVGKIIEYDFRKELPEIKKYADENNLIIYENLKEKNKIIYSIKYMKLMYRYNALLDFMVSLAETHDIKSLKDDIKEFVRSRNR